MKEVRKQATHKWRESISANIIPDVGSDLGMSKENGKEAGVAGVK